jgi:hypothetical protein
MLGLLNFVHFLLSVWVHNAHDNFSCACWGIASTNALCVCVCFDDTWLFIVWQRHMTNVVWLFESINNPGLKFIKAQSLWDILYVFLTAEIQY